VDTGLLHLDQEFDFLIPEELSSFVFIGSVVKVPFNRKRVLGVVTERLERSDFRGELKFIIEVIRPFPLLTKNILVLVNDVKKRYGGTRWDVIRFALPSLNKNDKEYSLPESANNSHRQKRAESDNSWYPETFWRELANNPTAKTRVRVYWNPPPASDPFHFLKELTRCSTRSALIVVPDRTDVDRLVDIIESSAARGSRRVIGWHSDLPRSERAALFLEILHNHSLIVVGVRSALFLPLSDLDQIILWDEGSESHVEQRSPYFHAREVAIMRSHIDRTHLVLAGYAPSLQSISYIERKYLAILSPDKGLLGQRRISVLGIDERKGPWDIGRIPTSAWQTIREGLKKGPVLVSVPIRGYVQSISCNSCRNTALCSCGGKLIRASKQNELHCNFCGKRELAWICQYCSGREIRFQSVGDLRIVEELGKTFPNQRILSSNSEHRLLTIKDEPVVVISTPGAEPLVTSGYSAAVALNSSLILNRASLDAEELARRRWFELGTMLRPGGALFIDTEMSNRNMQALLRWNSIDIGVRELEERRALGLPPVARIVEIVGDSKTIKEVVSDLVDNLDIFLAKSSLENPANEVTMNIRIKGVNPALVIDDLLGKIRTQSAKGKRVPRVRVDPSSL
jgi:primosomal protein N' (replication factor Y)